MNREQIDAWATDILKQLILCTHAALGERPPEVPDYLESEIISNGIRAKIRVEFSEDYGVSNGMPLKSNQTLPQAFLNTFLNNSQERRQAIQYIVVIWTAMLILGGLFYWFLVIAR